MTARVRPTQLDPDTLVTMLTATRNWLKERHAKGEVEVAYGFAEGGGVAVVSVPSHEALNTAIQEYPLNPVTDWEIFVLCDADQAIEQNIRLLKERAALVAARAA